MVRLVLCTACERHFRLHEPTCPFCGAALADGPRAPRIVLSPGASRSRRYAASAAFVAGGAMAACGGSTSSNGSEKSGHGGMQTDAAVSDGGSQSAGGRSGTGGKGASGTGGSLGTGGRLSSGGALNGGALNGGALNGGALNGGAGSAGASGGGTGGVGSARHACMGSMDMVGQMLCRATADCPGGFYRCVTSTPASGCGNPTFIPQQCTIDSNCTGGNVCVTGACNAHQCLPACTPSSCGAGTSCVGGHCVPLQCEADGGACAANYVCAPGDPAADANGCAPKHCKASSDCPLPEDCDPKATGLGCVRRACTVDGDCSCGYCVNGSCEATLGYCYQMIAMPYGCVWPDEELV